MWSRASASPASTRQASSRSSPALRSGVWLMSWKYAVNGWRGAPAGAGGHDGLTAPRSGATAARASCGGLGGARGPGGRFCPGQTVGPDSGGGKGGGGKPLAPPPPLSYACAADPPQRRGPPAMPSILVIDDAHFRAFRRLALE